MSRTSHFCAGSARAQAAAATLEAQHQKALAAETERLEGVLRDKAELNARWDEQNRALVEGHERVVHEVTTEFEGKLAVRTDCSRSHLTCIMLHMHKRQTNACRQLHHAMYAQEADGSPAEMLYGSEIECQAGYHESQCDCKSSKGCMFSVAACKSQAPDLMNRTTHIDCAGGGRCPHTQPEGAR